MVHYSELINENKYSSHLDHELGNDAVEDGATVGEPLLVLAAGDAVEVPATKQIN